jgi:pimeloyl-ACP methyl ester carboxylesterase
MDHFGIQQANLIGHDWGAVVAWSVALTWPERVKKLGILNVPHPVVMLKYLRSNLKQLRKSWYIGFFQIPGLADWMMARDNFRMAARMLIGSGRKSTFSRADLEAYKQAWSQPGALTAMINWYRAMVWHRPPTPKDIRLQMPVLIQWGKQDVALSYEMAEESIKLCDNGRLIFYDNATHWVQHDEADAVNKELLAFLQA